MIRNYLKIAWRNLKSQKWSSFTTLFSLSIGVVSIFFISIYINQELSYDKFHDNLSNIYKLNTKIESPTGNLSLGLTATPVGDYLKSVSPEIKEFVRVYKEYGSHSIKFGEKLFSEGETIYYADPTFFDVFSFKTIAGNTTTSLVGPDKIMITRRTALKYFGTTDNVINKALLYDGTPFTITGIIEDIPSNSQLQFDFLISMDTFYKNRPTADQNWGWFPMNTFLLLNKSSNLDALNDKIKNIPQYLNGEDKTQKYSVSMEPMKGLHFSEPKLGELGTKGDLTNIIVLFVIGIMILLLAISNFINLTTAQISIQLKEISVKKILGASKADIFKQFIVESVLLTFIALLISYGIIVLTMPFFESLIASSFDMSFLLNPEIILLIIALPIVLVLLGGVYPAIKFSNIKTIHNHKSTVKKAKLFNTRTSLLVFQFSITSFLVICSLIAYVQLNFVKNKNLGINTKHKIVLDYGPNSEIGNSYESLKSELNNISGVESVTFSSQVPGQMPNGVTTVIKDDKGNDRTGEINLTLVDEDFIKNYGLHLIAGRDFRKGIADKTSALILNKATVKAFGYTNPEDIIGASFEQWGGNGKVIGVVSDFNYLSLHEDIGLLSLKIWPDQFEKITLEVQESNVKNVIANLQTKWSSLYPNIPFKYYFVDDNFNAQYNKDQKFSSLINAFTLISLLIGVLGLLAYASFWCDRKRKEVAIKKVLGAKTVLLIWNFYKEFSKPVFIGFIIAIPLSYYLGHKWLQNFAYRFDFNWKFFALPLLLMLVFVWIVVGAQSIQISVANPVNNLKEE